MPPILLAAYATGIAIAYNSAPLGTPGYCLLAGTLLLTWSLLHRSAWAWLPVLGMICLAGALNCHQQLSPPADNNHVSRQADSTYMFIEATVENIEQRASGGVRLLVNTKAISADGTTIQPASGKILLYTREGETRVRPGQFVRWRSRLRKPLRFGNPGEFNYPLYLASREVYATAFVRHSTDIVAIENHPGQQAAQLENLRIQLAKRIGLALPENQVALVQSLLLGIRSGMTSMQRQVLADGGIAHLFAISGLHFGLLALLLYQTGKYIYSRSQTLMYWKPPQKVIPLLLIMPLAGYMLLTGNSFATRRAFMMVSIASLLIVSNRRVSPFNVLSLVALFLLLHNPLALFQAGFQLSFSGVAGILLWLPGWQDKTRGLPQLLRWSIWLFLTTLAATISTAPSLLWHFHQITPAGLATNMIAIPLVAWGAVPFGLTGLALLPVSTALADKCLQLSGALVGYTYDLAQQLSSWPLLEPTHLFLSMQELILLVGLLIILIPMKGKRAALRFRAVTLLISTSLAFALTDPKASLQMNAISVGQGDATLISIAGESHYLVDGGGLPQSSIDTGKDLVLPALGRLGIRQLDGVILSHNHPDHSSGLISILKNYPVSKFYYAGGMKELPPELQQTLAESRAVKVELSQGWHEINQADKESLYLFVPEQDAPLNERSIIAYAGNQETGILLTADAGKPVLQQLVSAGLPGPVEILKLPHHGSRHSAPELFLEWLRPQISFVSVGRKNPYRFPHDKTVEACSDYQSSLYRTDQDGLLRFTLVGSQWQISTASERLKHFAPNTEKAL